MKYNALDSDLTTQLRFVLVICSKLCPRLRGYVSAKRVILKSHNAIITGIKQKAAKSSRKDIRTAKKNLKEDNEQNSI